MTIEITGLRWVPDFAKGYVRDVRARWACEEIGLPYRTRLLDVQHKPQSYFDEQPWGQVPVLRDGDVELFESGAILMHLAAKDTRLLPKDPQRRATATSWVFAAYNSVEPMLLELANIRIFARGEEWAKLREPSLMAFIGGRLDRLADHLQDGDWLVGDFTIADLAMASILRGTDGTSLLDERPALKTYYERALARPAFQRARAAQLADFSPEPLAA